MTRLGFTCTAIRDGHGWFVHCDQHRSACANVRILAQAVPHMKRAIAAALDVPEDQITVEVHPVLPEAVHTYLHLARQLRQTASRANHASALHVRAAARVLSQQGLPLRDIGFVLGVSHQRAHQLLRG